MDYLLENASEILKLCISLALIGVFVVCITITRTIYLSNKLLKKVNDLTDLFISYIQKPLSKLIQAEQTVSSIIKWINKR